MRKLLFAFLLFSISSFIYAQEKNVLSVLMKDATSVYFLLVEKPVITFENSDVKIVSSKKEAVIARDFVDSFEFIEEIPSSVDDVEDKVVDESFELSGDVIHVGGLTPGCVVKLFSINGQMLISEVAKEDNGVTLQLDTLPAGIYIVNYYDTTIKFIKR